MPLTALLQPHPSLLQPPLQPDVLDVPSSQHLLQSFSDLLQPALSLLHAPAHSVLDGSTSFCAAQGIPPDTVLVADERQTGMLLCHGTPGQLHGLALLSPSRKRSCLPVHVSHSGPDEMKCTNSQEFEDILMTEAADCNTQTFNHPDGLRPSGSFIISQSEVLQSQPSRNSEGAHHLARSTGVEGATSAVVSSAVLLL